MIKAVILDMDGVLVDSEPIHIKSFEIYMDELGLNYPENYIHSFIGFSIAYNVERINKEFLTGREIPVARAEAHRDEIYMDLLRQSKLEPIDGIMELIQFCKNNQLKCGLASSSAREQVDLILNSMHANGFDIKTQFDSIVSGDDVQHRKPAPDIYLKTLNHLKLKGPECWTIEDSVAGVTSAKHAGINCIALESPYVEKVRLEEANLTVDSIKKATQYLSRFV